MKNDKPIIVRSRQKAKRDIEKIEGKKIKDVKFSKERAKDIKGILQRSNMLTSDVSNKKFRQVLNNLSSSKKLTILALTQNVGRKTGTIKNTTIFADDQLSKNKSVSITIDKKKNTITATTTTLNAKTGERMPVKVRVSDIAPSAADSKVLDSKGEYVKLKKKFEKENGAIKGRADGTEIYKRLWREARAKTADKGVEEKAKKGEQSTEEDYTEEEPPSPEEQGN